MTKRAVDSVNLRFRWHEQQEMTGLGSGKLSILDVDGLKRSSSWRSDVTLKLVCADDANRIGLDFTPSRSTTKTRTRRIWSSVDTDDDRTRLYGTDR
jgi:hypothetical protein